MIIIIIIPTISSVDGPLIDVVVVVVVVVFTV
jgi:hypothetical protein